MILSGEALFSFGIRILTFERTSYTYLFTSNHTEKDHSRRVCQVYGFCVTTMMPAVMVGGNLSLVRLVRPSFLGVDEVSFWKVDRACALRI